MWLVDWTLFLLFLIPFAMGWWPCCCGDLPLVCTNCDTGTTPATLSIAVPANEFTNDTCTQCNNLNTTFVIDQQSACSFESSHAHCNGGLVNAQIQSTTLAVQIGTVAKCDSAPFYSGTLYNYFKTITTPIDCSTLNEVCAHVSTQHLFDCAVAPAARACNNAATSVTVT